MNMTNLVLEKWGICLQMLLFLDDLLGIRFLFIETFDGFVFVFSLGLMWWHGRSLRTSRSVMRIIPFRNSLVYAMI